MTTTPWRSRALDRAITHRTATPDVDVPWQVDALCAQVDSEIFFPRKGESTRPPKAVCAACPVRAECLDYALTRHITHGVWGGLSDRERRRLHRTAQPAAAAA